jgi:hypothetical protein
MNQPWHLLVYIAADNSLYDDALVSLRQITDASLLSTIKITVQFDGPSAENCARFRCADGKRYLVWASPAGYSADRAVRLRDFLHENAPKNPTSERVFLVLWGHGAGLDHVYLYNNAPGAASVHSAQETPSPVEQETRQNLSAEGGADKFDVAPSIPFDLLNPDNAHANRYLKDIQLAEILGDFSHQIGRRIDLLGFDACLMGLAEICHEVSKSVSLIVASDEELPKGSWPYNTILQDLTQFPGMDACTLSAVIVSRFLERYAEEGKRTRISLSAYNLSACDHLVIAVRGLVEGITVNLSDPDQRSRLFLARNFSRTPEVTDYVDLGVFCNEIIRSFDPDSAVSHRSREILEVLVKQPYIFYHRDASEFGAIVPMGLAIYFPDKLPPDANAVTNAVRAGRGFSTYQPLAPAERSSSQNSWRTYHPEGGATPLAASGMKTPTANTTKTLIVTTPTKTVTANHTKTPTANTTKGEVAGRQVSRQLIGSEILWDQYEALEFNQKTGWAALVKLLLSPTQGQAGYTGQPAASSEFSQTPHH